MKPLHAIAGIFSRCRPGNAKYLLSLSVIDSLWRYKGLLKLTLIAHAGIYVYFQGLDRPGRKIIPVTESSLCDRSFLLSWCFYRFRQVALGSAVIRNVR
jgi:hypothetical protein